MARFSKIDELPFDFIRRRLSIVVSDEHRRHTLICKGAVEEMLAIATHISDDGNILPLDEKARAELLQLATHYNEQGFRVLMVGTRDLGIDGCVFPLSNSDERDLVICGLLTFLDPPKASAAEAITALRENGVMVKVLTGDNPIITSKICRDVGLEPGEPLLGSEIEGMSDEQLSLLAEQRTVFAKLTPLQNLAYLKHCRATTIPLASSVMVSMMHQRCAMPTSVSQSIRALISRKSQPILSCWKKI